MSTSVGSALLIAGTLMLALPWAGLPLWLAARRLFGSRPVTRDDAHRPSITVVVASREPAPAIRGRVEDLLVEAYPAERIEIVIALDAAGAFCSMDELAGIDTRVRVVMGDQPGGKACTLNAALREARSEIIVFADTRQRFSRGAFAALVAPFIDSTVGAVSGRYELPAADAGSPIAWYWQHESWIRRTEAEIHSSIGVIGPIWAMRRELWEPLRSGLILDDVQTPMRLVRDGWRVAFAETASAREPHASTPESEWRRKVRTLTGNLQLLAWNPWLLVPWRNPLWLTYILHKLLRFTSPYGAMLAAAGAAVLGVNWLRSAFTGTELLGSALAAILLLTAVSPLRRKGTRLVHWIAVMQAALLVGAWNGLRGRWDVWRR